MKVFENIKTRVGAGEPPKPEETFGTLEAPVGDDARDKAAGRIHQFNIRVAMWVKERVKHLKRAERCTNGELMEAMIAAYEANGASLKPGQVPVNEARKRRLRPVQFWATEGVYGAITRVAAERQMSVSDLMEDWLAREVARLDPHGSGKFGVGYERR